MTLVRLHDPLDSSRRVALIADSGPPDADTALELYQRLAGELEQASAAVEAARAKKAAEVATDRGDLAAWHLGGGKGKKPTGASVAAASAELDEAERQYEGLRQAVSSCVREAERMLEERHDEWLAAAQKIEDVERKK